MTTKIAVCQLWDKNSKLIADLTWDKNKKLYCEHWNYSYHTKLEESVELYDANLAKFILDIMNNNPEYEWLYWSSTDTLFTNFYIQLENFIDDKNSMLLTKDFNNKLTSLMIKNTKTSRDFLDFISKRNIDENIFDNLNQYQDSFKVDDQQLLIFNVVKSQNGVGLSYDKSSTENTWIPGNFSTQFKINDNKLIDIVFVKLHIMEKFLSLVRYIISDKILNKFKFDRIE